MAISKVYRSLGIAGVTLVLCFLVSEVAATSWKPVIELKDFKETWVGMDEVGVVHSIRFEDGDGELAMIKKLDRTKLKIPVKDISLSGHKITITLEEPWVYARSRSKLVRGRGFKGTLWLKLPGTGKIVFRSRSDLEEDFRAAGSL